MCGVVHITPIRISQVWVGPRYCRMCWGGAGPRLPMSWYLGESHVCLLSVPALCRSVIINAVAGWDFVVLCYLWTQKGEYEGRVLLTCETGVIIKLLSCVWVGSGSLLSSVWRRGACRGWGWLTSGKLWWKLNVCNRVALKSNCEWTCFYCLL
jgi:hypothetical protein